ncbi:hypothetical protein AMQ83_27355 [Paenibacillus riograndensis]|nr:hypothetical protein AMQ83_27355 [Paenibacillus riograndensis]
MLGSLVGSDMCVRDSLRIPPFMPGKPPFPLPLPPPLKSVPPFLPGSPFILEPGSVSVIFWEVMASQEDSSMEQLSTAVSNEI